MYLNNGPSLLTLPAFPGDQYNSTITAHLDGVGWALKHKIIIIIIITEIHFL